MDDFIDYLAQRKWGWYRSLYIKVPQAYTEDECFARIKWHAAYLQIIDVINQLPLEHQREVNKRFDELKG